MKHVLIFLSCLSVCCSFLLDSSTRSLPSGSGSGSDHYSDLMDLLTEARQSRQQMEQYIVGKLQTDLQEMKNKSEVIKDKYEILLKDFQELQIEAIRLSNDSGSKDDLENIKLMLNSSLQQTESNLQTIKISTHDIHHNLGVVQTQTRSNISNLQHKTTSTNDQVGFTACQGRPSNDISPVMVYRYIMTSYGINNSSLQMNSEIFTCERPGLYLTFTTSMAYNSGVRFSIQRTHDNITVDIESVQVSPVHDLRGSRNYNFHSGSGSAVVELKVNDKITIKPMNMTRTNPEYNCLTVVKID